MSARDFAKKTVGRVIPAPAKKWLKEAAAVVRFTAPDPLRPSVPTSAKVKDWSKVLRRDGIVRIESPELKEFAAYLERIYYGALDGGAALKAGLFAKVRPVPQMEGLRKSGLGREEQYLVSLKDPNIERFFLNPDIVGLFYNYLRRQAYYRNQPVIDRVVLDPKAEPVEDLCAFHVDHLRQMSGMLLLAETDLNTTRMQYLIGSHKRSLIKHGIYLERSECKELVRKAGPQALCDLTGAPGTLYVFDASGIHRRHLIPGSTRKMFHWNVTTGHHLQPLEDDIANWPALRDSPDFVRKAFTGERVADQPGY